MFYKVKYNKGINFMSNFNTVVIAHIIDPHIYV